MFIYTHWNIINSMNKYRIIYVVVVKEVGDVQRHTNIKILYETKSENITTKQNTTLKRNAIKVVVGQ